MEQKDSPEGMNTKHKKTYKDLVKSSHSLEEAKKAVMETTKQKEGDLEVQHEKMEE